MHTCGQTIIFVIIKDPPPEYETVIAEINTDSKLSEKTDTVWWPAFINIFHRIELVKTEVYSVQLYLSLFVMYFVAINSSYWPNPRYSQQPPCPTEVTCTCPTLTPLLNTIFIICNKLVFPHLVRPKTFVWFGFGNRKTQAQFLTTRWWPVHHRSITNLKLGFSRDHVLSVIWM